jgi:hypothetical protein
MAILFDGPVSPADLTTFTREVPIPRDLTFLNAFPARYLTTNTVDFSEIVKTNRTARFRSFDGRIHVSQRDGGSDKRVKLFPRDGRVRASSACLCADRWNEHRSSGAGGLQRRAVAH